MVVSALQPHSPWSGNDALLVAIRHASHRFRSSYPRTAASLMYNCKALAAHISLSDLSCLKIQQTHLKRGDSKAVQLPRGSRFACSSGLAVAPGKYTCSLDGVTAATSNGRANSGLSAAELSMGEVRSFLESLQLLNGSSTATPPADVCNQFLRGYARTAKWPAVWKCYQQLENAGVHIEQDTYIILWEQAMKAGYYSQGVSLFHRSAAVHGQPSQKAFVTIISRLLKRRARGALNTSLAYQLWRELNSSTVALDVVSFRAGLNACIEDGRLAEADHIMRHMRNIGLRPGVGAFNILIKYHARRGDMEAARRVFLELKAMRYVPDAITYNTMLDGYAHAGDLIRARAVIDKMRYEGCQPDVWTYSSYIHGCCRQGHMQLAEEALDEMKAAGVAPNQHTYGCIVDGYMRRNDVAQADRVVASMRAAGLPPNRVVYNTLIKGHSRSGPQGQVRAFQLLSEMSREGVQPGIDTYSILIDAAVNGDHNPSEAAASLLQQLQAEGLEPDAVVLTTLMAMHQRAGRPNEAHAVFQHLTSSSTAAVDVVALNALVHVHASVGAMDEAEAAAKQAAEYAVRHGLKAPVEAFGALIKGYYRLGQLRPAIMAFRRLLKLGGKPHRRICNAVVRLCLQQGKVTLAYQTIRAMQLTGVNVNQERYQQWIRQYQNRYKPDEGLNIQLERLKFWLGLKNNYYQSDWR